MDSHEKPLTFETTLNLTIVKEQKISAKSQVLQTLDSNTDEEKKDAAGEMDEEFKLIRKKNYMDIDGSLDGVDDTNLV